jgi:hypothetical protein
MEKELHKQEREFPVPRPSSGIGQYRPLISLETGSKKSKIWSQQLIFSPLCLPVFFCHLFDLDFLKFCL